MLKDLRDISHWGDGFCMVLGVFFVIIQRCRGFSFCFSFSVSAREELECSGLYIYSESGSGLEFMGLG